ncbi:MAG TPA: hypothetical protein VEA63_08560, partial [Opitutus sp.]|nr:hypothetical protein [Opitutus sp.]
KVLRRSFATESEMTIDTIAWLAAVLWAVHPLRVEPVAWITASGYPLATAFLLGSFGCYLTAYHDEHDTHGKKRRRWIAGAWALAALAYGSYPITATFGLWLIAVDVGWLRIAPQPLWKITRADARVWWAKQLLFLAPALLALGVTVWSRLFSPGEFTHAPGMANSPVADRGLMALASLGWFVVKFFWPTALTPNHQSLEIDVWSEPAIVALAAVTIVLALGLFLTRRKASSWIWIGAGFAGLSLPCLGLTEYPAWPVNRYSYLLDVVLVGTLAVALLSVVRRLRMLWPGVAPVAVGAAILTSMLAAYSSMWLLPIWRDSDRLFMHMENDPQTRRSPALQAHLYLLWARHAARENLARGTTLRLNQAQRAYLSAIVGALQGGDFPRAVRLADRLEADLGLTAVMRRERAGWLLKLGRTNEALSELAKVIEATPNDLRTRELLEEASGAESVPTL